MRSADFTADILNFISDGKVHTLDEIAVEVECSKRTVQRHIEALSYRYPIISIRGNGQGKQGIKLEAGGLVNQRILTRMETETLHGLLEKCLTLDNLSNQEKRLINKLISN